MSTQNAPRRHDYGPDLRVALGPLGLDNPVMPASGCFGPELGSLFDLNRLGAMVTKTIFFGARSGNPAHRLAETPGGMLNSVGIPSRGVDAFVEQILPEYRRWQTPTIVSLGGLSVEEYWDLADRLRGVPGIAALELNVSCPNLEAGGIEMGASPAQVEAVVRGVVDRSTVPVISKLTPNVTSIAEIARASEAGGATAITAVNTLVGMAVDLDTRAPVIGNMVGGLSGPAIKPIALRMVWEVRKAVSIPVIGCGGIARACDALEFLVVGATVVQVGTATFTRPDAMLGVIDGIADYVRDRGLESIRDLIGTLRTDRGAAETAPELTLAASTGHPAQPAPSRSVQR